MADKKEIFARVETTLHGQCLIELKRGDEGPELHIRVSEVGGVSPKATIGPWADSDEGWAAADKLLAELDLAKVAENLVNKVQSIMGGGNG